MAAAKGLSAEERETTVVWTDADDEMIIHTCQRKIVTDLLANPAARLIRDDNGHFEFRLAVGLLTFRKGKRGSVTETSSKPKGKRGSHLAGVQKCDHIKDNGDKCQMIAKKGTTKCRWHQEV